MFKVVKLFCVLSWLILLNGCVVATVVSVTATAIGTTVDVIDAVTPDIISDDDVIVEADADDHQKFDSDNHH